MVPICMVFLIMKGHFYHVHCTLCEEKEDEPNSGVQQCSAVFKIMQKCIHFTGIYSMLSIKTGCEVHNDIQLISKKGAKMFTQCYSNLTEKDKKGALC